MIRQINFFFLKKHHFGVSIGLSWCNILEVFLNMRKIMCK